MRLTQELVAQLAQTPADTGPGVGVSPMSDADYQNIADFLLQDRPGAQPHLGICLRVAALETRVCRRRANYAAYAVRAS